MTDYPYRCKECGGPCNDGRSTEMCDKGWTKVGDKWKPNGETYYLCGKCHERITRCSKD